MLREGTPYAADLSECCEASDSGDDVALHRGVGIDVDDQITHGTKLQYRGVVYTNSFGQDEMLTSRRRVPEPFGLRGVEQLPVSSHTRLVINTGGHPLANLLTTNGWQNE